MKAMRGLDDELHVAGPVGPFEDTVDAGPDGGYVDV